MSSSNRFMEVVGWCRIVASPLIIGSALGGLAFLALKDIYGIMLGCAIALFGLILGVFWANKVWREHGTMKFMSRIKTTPDIKSLEELRENEEKKRRPSS
jgi:hypothetical protein